MNTSRNSYKPEAEWLCEITHNGKTTLWEICPEDLFAGTGRAYLVGQSAYYDLGVFTEGLKKADDYRYYALTN